VSSEDLMDVSWLGLRVSVRTRAGGGRFTDTVGHLLALTTEGAQVLRRDGRLTELVRADVVAAKVVPPEPVRPGWDVPPVTPDALQRICHASWPAREVTPLGDWLRRAHGGITGRANSTLASGDPGRPLEEALAQTAQWYAERGLPPLLQLPLGDPVNPALERLGWERRHVTVVQVAPVESLLRTLPEQPGLTTRLADRPDDAWCAMMHDLAADTASHLAILTAPPVVTFATVLRDGLPVGIGRASVEGAWTGITSVDVAPLARRQGVGSAVMRALVAWAAGVGARATYLQVRAGNAGALRLYAALGYRTHHPYVYRAPVDDGAA
jgi:GNAT superfamily N-acetyltransferase